MPWKTVKYTLAVLLALLVGAMLVGQFFGVPVVVSYVETDSMEGTLDAGDGYIAIPAEVAGPVEEGDVITFDAQELHAGGLTTHRVVDVTDQGYVTKGDANPFTDQDNEEPPVTDGQVVAKALQVDGSVVTIPHLGTAVTTIGGALEWVQFRLASLFGLSALLGTQGLAYILFGVGGLFLLSGFVGDLGRSTDRSRNRRRSRKHIYNGRTLVVLLFGFWIAITAGTMAVSSGSTEAGIVSAEFDSDRPDVIPRGETEEQTMTVRNDGVLPMVVIVESASEGVQLNESVHHVGRGDKANVTVSYTAPPETGYYLRSLDEYRYFGVLPTSLIQSLHSIHPWVALLAVTVSLVVPLAIGVHLLIGSGRIRTRDRRRNRPHSGL
jgi:signal peptidase